MLFYVMENIGGGAPYALVFNAETVGQAQFMFGSAVEALEKAEARLKDVMGRFDILYSSLKSEEFSEEARKELISRMMELGEERVRLYHETVSGVVFLTRQLHGTAVKNHYDPNNLSVHTVSRASSVYAEWLLVKFPAGSTVIVDKIELFELLGKYEDSTSSFTRLVNAMLKEVAS